MMEYSQLIQMVSTVDGAAIIEMDVTTFASGVKKSASSVKALLFNSERSGYEEEVKFRLKYLGYNPDNFVGGELPWGRRLYGPIITHKDKNYLQVIILDPGKEEYFLSSIRGFDVPCRREDLPTRMKWLNQGLPIDKQVEVRTFGVEGITRLEIVNQLEDRPA